MEENAANAVENGITNKGSTIVDLDVGVSGKRKESGRTIRDRSTSQ